MKNKLITSSLFILTIILFGYTDPIKVNINDHINEEQPIKITLNKKTGSTGLTSSYHVNIYPFTETSNKLIEWGNANTEGWEATDATYISEINLVQDNFKLFYTSGKGSVVVGFTDQKGKEKQYIKSIPEGELDFLLKEANSAFENSK